MGRRRPLDRGDTHGLRNTRRSGASRDRGRCCYAVTLAGRANELLAIVSNGSEAEVVGGIPAPGPTMMLEGGVISVSSTVASDPLV
jgi:hypothetical protein